MDEESQESDEEFEKWVSLVESPKGIDMPRRASMKRRSLLHVVLLGRVDRVRSLLAINVCPDTICSDMTGRTALHFAAACGHCDIIDALCDAGASVDYPDKPGFPPAKLAFFCGRTESLECFRRRGADLSFLPEPAAGTSAENELRNAALLGEVHKARGVLESLERSPDRLREVLQSRDQFDRTPLTYSSWLGHEAIVQLLLQHVAQGVDVDVEDVDSQTPLAFAVGSGRAAVVRLLLEAGANAEAEVPPGITLVGKAAFGDDVECLRHLLQFVPSVDFAGNRGETGLLTAAQHGSLKALQCLLEAGANINDQSAGISALAGACSQGQWRAVKALIEAGANVNITPEKGDARLTPLKMAVLWSQLRCVRALLLVKELKFDEGVNYTALHFAILRKERKMVELLLRAGASKWRKSETPLTSYTSAQLARHMKHDDMAVFLEQYFTSLADACRRCIRKTLPSPLTEVVVHPLPLPAREKRRLLFLK